jgi:hypothetical protein
MDLSRSVQLITSLVRIGVEAFLCQALWIAFRFNEHPCKEQADFLHDRRLFT